jgi:uncharacterized protein (TIGR02099 family)
LQLFSVFCHVLDVLSSKVAIRPLKWLSTPNQGPKRRTESRSRGNIIAKAVFHITRFCTRTLFWVGVTVSVLFAVVVLSLKYAVLPNIERYQGDIISRVAAASGMDVSASAIRGGWSGASPHVELENVQFIERMASPSAGRTPGAPALKLPKLRASISWWSLLTGQIRFSELSIDGPELVLSRRMDGLIYFAGRAINQPAPQEDDGQLLAFLLEQPGLEIRNATLEWQDDLTPGAILRLTEVGLTIRKSGRAHEIGLVASPPRALARKVQLAGDLQLDNVNGRWIAIGRLYAMATDANLREFRQHANVPDALQAGFGNVRTWVDIDNSKLPPANAKTAAANTSNAAWAAFQPIRAITTDLHITNASVQLEAGLQPLNLAKLAGRIDYKAEPGGFAVQSKALELRTRDGVVLPSADFSLMLRDQGDLAKAKGEATGNGIDMKVMATLIEYFPVGKDVRALVARYSPRGMARGTTFSWEGDIEKPRVYKIKASLSDFGINAHDKTPGVTGFSGELDGDNTGGAFKIASKDLTLDAPEQFSGPIKLQQLAGSGKWKVTGDAIEVTLDKVAAENPDMAFEFAGRYSRFRADGAKAKQEKGPGNIDLRGKITRAKAASVAAYLPNGITDTRAYVKAAIQGGDITSADFLLKGDLFDFPFHEGKGGQFKLDANLKNVDFKYFEGWPAASAVSAVLSFDNTKISAKIDSARIFNANLKKTNLLIADTARRPSVLGITGEVDARAEDVTRYLRESPLANSVGAFTKFVSLDGPGKLNLDLSIPMGTPEVNAAARLAVAVKGDYTLSRGNAKLALGGPAGTLISNVSGTVAFSESGVRSTSGQGIQGLAFGNPMTVSLGMQDGSVVTEFAARANVAELRELTGVTLPAQVSGVAELRGRVLPKANGMEVAVESSLTGVTSVLPYPLGKRSEEPRALRVLLTNPGQASERVRILLGGLVAADRPQSEAETKVELRLQRRFDASGNAQGLAGGIASIGETASTAPIPEGLWIEGTLPRFDFDQWRQAIDAAFPKTAGGPADAARKRNESALAGFDVKLGSLTAYGRPFKAMTLRGRHSAEDWRFVVESDEASGDFTWRPGAFEERGAVRARLKTLSIAEETPTSASATPQNGAAKDAEFPALDIVADSFTLKGRWLGKMELRATPQTSNWKIDQLVISNGHAKVEMDGLWQRYGDPERPAPANAPVRSRTVMKVKVESNNMNALFNQFGFGEQVRGGSGKLDGWIAWPGHTYDFATAKMSGNFKVEAVNGTFSKVEAGAGKLLGLISLQSLPRRITLDFRDIFSNGFPFDRISGDVKIENGIMFTENFEIVGPPAEVKMAGDVSLPSERANLLMTVVPKLDETVALGAGLVTLNPLIGVAVFVGQKVIGNPFEKMFSYKYAVTGAWDNPDVERVSRGTTVPPPVSNTPVPAPQTPEAPKAAQAARTP